MLHQPEKEKEQKTRNVSAKRAPYKTPKSQNLC